MIREMGDRIRLLRVSIYAPVRVRQKGLYPCFRDSGFQSTHP